MPDLPNNFGLIIGAMKCATTSLYSYLAEHPQIAPCRTKEPYFLSSDEFLTGGMAEYRNLWQWDPARHTVALEASTSYTKIPFSPNVAERLSTVRDAEFRFIYMMRHPINRMDSHLIHMAGWHVGTMRVIKQRLWDEAIAYSSYAMQLEPYRQHFGRDRLLLLFTEDLQRDPARVVRQCFDFLQVDPDFVPPSLGRHLNEGAGYWAGRIRPPLWHHLRRMNTYHRVKRIIPAGMRQRLGQAVNQRSVQRLKLNPVEREAAMERLMPDLSRLQEEYELNAMQRWELPVTCSGESHAR